MRPRPARALILVPVLVLSAGPRPEATAGAAPPRQRGVAWVGGPEIVTVADLEPLVRSHVDWIAQTPFGWQKTFDAPEIRLATGGRVWWGESDEGIAATARLGRARGIETLLKPHIWLGDHQQGKWLGDIRMASEEDWRRWLASYRTFILHYAELAQASGIEALAVGCELRPAATERERDFRDLIAAVRKVYRGRLTYAANWYEEFREIRFWDALDFVGIQAYFPLAQGESPTLDELLAAWQRHQPAIEEVARRTGKPVVFTEIGYRSVRGALARPWEWPESAGRGRAGFHDPLRADPQTQALAYEAFFRTFWERPWFGGAYFWKWYPKLRSSDPGDVDFTPQGKAAAAVLARWYGGARPSGSD